MTFSSNFHYSDSVTINEDDIVPFPSKVVSIFCDQDKEKSLSCFLGAVCLPLFIVRSYKVSNYIIISIYVHNVTMDIWNEWFRCYLICLGYDNRRLLFLKGQWKIPDAKALNNLFAKLKRLSSGNVRSVLKWSQLIGLPLRITYWKLFFNVMLPLNSKKTFIQRLIIIKNGCFLVKSF